MSNFGEPNLRTMENEEIKGALGDYLRCKNISKANVGAALAAADKILDAMNAALNLIPADSVAVDEVQRAARDMLAMLAQVGETRNDLDESQNEILDAYYDTLCDLVAA